MPRHYLQSITELISSETICLILNRKPERTINEFNIKYPDTPADSVNLYCCIKHRSTYQTLKNHQKKHALEYLISLTNIIGDFKLPPIDTDRSPFDAMAGLDKKNLCRIMRDTTLLFTDAFCACPWAYITRLAQRTLLFLNLTSIEEALPTTIDTNWKHIKRMEAYIQQ